jgi:hypothetical protein
MARKIGEIADEIFVLQEEAKALEKEVQDKKKNIETLKVELIAAAALENLTLGGGAASKFKIEPKVVPQATDWDAFYAWMAKKKYFHLLQRRLTTTGCSELWEQNVKIPGVDKYVTTQATVKGA